MTRFTSLLIVSIITLVGVSLAREVKSQDLNKVRVTLSVKEARLDKILDDLERQSGFSFTYPQEIGKLGPFTISVKNETLLSTLQKLASGNRLSFKPINKLISVSQLPVASIPGKISGKVLDDKGEALPGATIKITETGQATQSAVDGTYTFSLQPGTYTIEVSFISCQAQRITGIVVQESKITYLNIAMKPASKALNEVLITSGFRKASAAGLYARQKNAAGLTDGISAEQIGRTPDKNIGESLKRINGVNVVENKYVVVRGLGERYNSAMINGQVMPSTELNRKQFSFDIIPANMVDNITVYKTITPDKSAEFGGGLVEVNTKTLPDENYLNLTIGGTANNKTTGKNFRAQQISGGSYLGAVSADRKLFGKTDWKNIDDLKAYYAVNPGAQQFKNNWGLYNYTPTISPNLQFDLGKTIKLKHNDRLGVMASLSYRNTWQTADVHMGRNGYTISNDTSREALYGYTGKRYGFTTNLGAIAGMGYTGRSWTMSLQSIYLRTYDQQLLLGTGDKDDFPESVGYFDVTTQTSMLQNQLKGSRKFGDRGIKLDWLASYTVLDRQRPDNHQFDASYVGDEKDNPLLPASDFSITSARSNLLSSGVLRSWNRSFEKNLSWNADLTIPLNFKVAGLQLDNKLKTGYAGWRKDRLFWVLNTATKFSNNGLEPLSEKFDPYLHPDGTIEFSGFSDQYHNVATLHAGYAMLDSRIGSHFRVTGGVRGEYYDLNGVNTLLETFIKNQIEKNQDVTDYSGLFGYEPKFNWFPSATLTYSPTQQMNIRFSFAKSIIRPDLRELAYFNEYDFELGGIYQSSTPVRSTRIDHYDFRYEWYPGPGEIVSFSLFYKKLKYPMEIYALENRIYELRNDQSAKNKGIEVEFRKSLTFTGVPVLRNFTLYGNFTRLFAKVTPMTVTYQNTDPDKPDKVVVTDNPSAEVERPQAGASNYTYNASILYDAKPFSLTLSYNYITNRLFRAADYYASSIFETPLPSLDAQVACRLLKNKAEIKLNVSNLLNRSSKFYQKRDPQQVSTLLYEKGDFLNYEAIPGRTYGLSFNYQF